RTFLQRSSGKRRQRNPPRKPQPKWPRRKRRPRCPLLRSNSRQRRSKMSSLYKFQDDPHLLNLRLNIGMTGFGKSTLLEYQLRRIVDTNRKRKRDRIIVIDPTQDDFHFDWFGRRATTAREIHHVLFKCPLAFHLRVISRDMHVFD